MFSPILLPDDAQPDDVFHVILDVIEAFNRLEGHPLLSKPWLDYCTAEDPDPKGQEESWLSILDAARDMSHRILEGSLPNPLNASDLGKDYLERVTRPLELTSEDEALLRGLLASKHPKVEES